MYKKEYVETFLKNQGQLFDEPVADDFEEAEAFLEDCMAVVLDSLKDVKKYLDGMGADVEGLSLKELEEESEVFKLPDGKYMIVGRGLGTHSINIRFCNRPQLLVVRLLPKQDEPEEDR